MDTSVSLYHCIRVDGRTEVRSVRSTAAPGHPGHTIASHLETYTTLTQMDIEKKMNLGEVSGELV